MSANAYPLFINARLYLLADAITDQSVHLKINMDPTFPPDGMDLTTIGLGYWDNLEDATVLHDVTIETQNIHECNESWDGNLNVRSTGDVTNFHVSLCLLVRFLLLPLQPDLMLCAGKLMRV